MAPQTGPALLILVAFVLPGFGALLISERTNVVPRSRSPFELLLVATYYSVVSWGLIAFALWPFGLDRADLRRMYRQESLGKLAPSAPWRYSWPQRLWLTSPDSGSVTCGGPY
jgi:hypothetical protein